MVVKLAADNQEEAVMECIAGNPVPWMTRYLKVQTKDNRIVPFGLSRATRNLAQEFTHRKIDLKARQLWVTTFYQAMAYAFAACIPNFKAGLVLHEDEAAERTFQDRILFFHRTLPEALRPPLEYERADLIKFRPYPESTGSSIFIGTASGYDFGRSGTLNMLLLSEFGRYKEPDANELMRGAAQAVPYDGWIIVESTPKGLGTPFWTLYTNAASPDSPWRRSFLPWHLNDEYHLPPPQGEAPIVLTPEELELAAIGVSQDQIRWYRWKRAELATAGQEETLAQEYPSDDIECWLTSQEGAFPGDGEAAIRRMLQNAAKPLRVVETLRQWKLPDPSARYLLFADVAEGLVKGDEQYAVLGNLLTGEHVASIRGKMLQDAFARQCCELAVLYNHALVVPERNTGALFINTCQRLGYSNLYRDGFGPTARVGLHTNTFTKPRMVEAMRQALAQGEFTSHDDVALRQMLEYRSTRTDNGSLTGWAAPAGGFDDAVIACMGFNYLRKTMPVGGIAPSRTPAVERYPEDVLAW